jgi:thiamine pyrophosphokinase
MAYAREKPVQQIVVVAALGARWDQTIANLLLPIAFPSIPIQITDGDQEIHYITGGNKHTLVGQTGDIVSLIPLASDAIGITTQGLEYPLNNETLFLGGTRGISNVLLGKQAIISIREGFLLCTIQHINK